MWMKRRGQPSPNPANPGVQMYNPNQHSTPQQPFQQWPQQQQQPAVPQQQPPYTNDWYGQSKAASKTPPVQQYQQPANSYWQQPAYSQPPQQQTFNTPQQPSQPVNQYPQQQQQQQQQPQPPYTQYAGNPPQNYYPGAGYGHENYSQQSRPQPHNYAPQNYYPGPQPHVQPNSASAPLTNQISAQPTEADPWNWGWDEGAHPPDAAAHNATVPATNITESFANDASWNWTVDDTNGAASQAPNEQVVSGTEAPGAEATAPSANKAAVGGGDGDGALQNSELGHEVCGVGAAVVDAGENRAGRRVTTDNLTPQWSIESQVSQDSSEDVLLTSESDNRSNVLSQSSTTSQSPSLPAVPAVEATAAEAPPAYRYEADASQRPPYRPENSQSLHGAMHELSLHGQFENKEIVTPELAQAGAQTPPVDPAPPPPKKASPPLAATSADKNPYKRAGGLALKAPVEPVFLQHAPSAFAARAPDSLGVNLETVPDNAERPDAMPAPLEPVAKPARKGAGPPWAENCEIAPINDRNQYLETGQLSDADVPVYTQPGHDYRQNVQTAADSLPPPGLRRLVLGQLEQPETAQSADEPPPPGLSRMVLGGGAPAVRRPPDAFPGHEGPPAGLHRMVPGESSSPESFVPIWQDQPADHYASESELQQTGVAQQRSATIGADTPPVTGPPAAGYSSSSSAEPGVARAGAVGTEPEPGAGGAADEGGASLDGAATGDKVSPVRDPTVGRNATDPAASATDVRRNARTYATDSEHEQPKERRYYEQRQGRRDSPPEAYRKYDRRRHKDARRYDEDTDYYSDKERKERRHREEREEYDRRYGSLRRDKDRRRGERREYEREDRRGEYYYNGRYEDEYYGNRSRPSSRSDSMHDAYRDRNVRAHDRDQDRTRHREHRRPRDPYNPYYQGYNYDAYGPYYQQYQYYENLRRTNPQAYAEWYRKYYQSQDAAGAHTAGYRAEDRASVHSGRSSANEELNKDRYTRQSFYSQQSLPHYYRENFRDVPNASTVYTVDDSRLLDQTDSSLILEDSTAIVQRLTPAKFATAHVKASIASGNFVNILPHYPLDGQPATLEIISVQSLLSDDPDQIELAEFPGPLVKGVTHKKTVIEYCENKIKRVQGGGGANVHDVESYVLMWELLILLLRQNGMVVGTDIAELLMKNRSHEDSRRQSVSSAGSIQHLDAAEHANEHGATRVSPAMHHKEDYITDKFREFLIYGSGKEALEWAMKHGLWGHALFLASKLDKRTYANVMMRFANGLTMNDPLQTLYQLLSGRQPAAVTSVADEKWGDWRPHLAMILSNTSHRPDLDRRAITTLGDTLHARGSLYAAHFCYLMAQVEFGRYGSPHAKLVLLSAAHTKPFPVFATNEAIFMTEIYEYACSLSDAAFSIPEFQAYKYLLASRLVDHGLLEKGLLYLECVALSIKQDPSHAQPSLVARVCELADRLKYYDPVQDDAEVDSSRADSSWLADLKAVRNDYNMGLITHQSTTNLTSLDADQDNKPVLLDQQQQQYADQQWQQQPETYQQLQQLQSDQQQQWHTDPANIDYTQQQQQQVHSAEAELNTDASLDNNGYGDVPQMYLQPQQPQRPPVWEDAADQHLSEQQQLQQLQQQNDYWNAAQSEPAETKKEAQSDESIQPQISMPNQSQGKSYYDDDVTDANKAQTKAAPAAKPKPVAPTQAKPASTGWFGGIWSKLALRPKNQMKLPDDKNPTIVWDSEKKRWVNLEEDNGDVNTELKPPPKMSEMFSGKPMPSGPTSLPTQLQSYPSQTVSPPILAPQSNPTPPAANNTVAAPAENPSVAETDGPKPPSQSNMFKLQRNRNIKKAYVDVFNPSGAPAKSTVPAAELFGAMPATGGQMNFFVPQPVADPNAPTDFLTPQNGGAEDNSQLSRWSSSSSLSREVQFYMQRTQAQKLEQTGGAPLMYNPTQFSNQQAQNGARGRYLNH